MSRHVAIDLSESYRESDIYNSNPGRFGNLPAFHQILIFLWYIGHQTASFRDVADRFDVTISCIHRIIKRVTMFLSNLSPQKIKWPTENEKIVIEQHFRDNGFPNVIGALDGSHIKIDKPEDDHESYFNRKNYYSIQECHYFVQAVCDHKRKILDLYVGYPGSVHDSRVFRNSPLNNSLQEKCGRYYILADSGYPLKANILTPYKNRGNLTRCQLNYNIKLSKNRYVIEHCFGVLKQKFRQLFYLKLRNVRLMVHFIRAACVLHNICLEDNFILEGAPEHPEIAGNQEVEDERDEEDDVDAILIRNRVAMSLAM